MKYLRENTKLGHTTIMCLGISDLESRGYFLMHGGGLRPKMRCWRGLRATHYIVLLRLTNRNLAIASESQPAQQRRVRSNERIHIEVRADLLLQETRCGCCVRRIPGQQNYMRLEGLELPRQHLVISISAYEHDIIKLAKQGEFICVKCKPRVNSLLYNSTAWSCAKMLVSISSSLRSSRSRFLVLASSAR